MHDTDIRAQLEQERRIIEDAYPGPWTVGAYNESTNSNYFGAVQDSEDPSEPGPLLGDAHLPDAAFIAHARTALPVRNAQVEAVLELHKPFDDEPSLCRGCTDPTRAYVYDVEFPCPTARAIEEAGRADEEEEA